jgi:thiamine biosynthesis lipoprotein
VRALAPLLLILMACASQEPPAPRSDGRYAMGTVLQVTVYGGDPDLLDALFARVEELEARVSSYRPASDVSRLSAASGQGPQSVSAEVARLLDACVGYTELTRGSFDITVGPLVELWTQAGRSGRRPSAAVLTEARTRVGADKLRVDVSAATAELALSGMAVDVGGIAKGTATDALAALLRDTDVHAAFIDFGGSSLHALGAPPDENGWRVLVRDGADGFAGVASLRDLALSVSSSLGQSVEIDGVSYGHVLDPRSGEALTERRQAVVVAPSGELAEALTKALLVLDEAESLALVETLYDVEALLIDTRGRRHFSSGFERAVSFAPQGPSYQMR